MITAITIVTTVVALLLIIGIIGWINGSEPSMTIGFVFSGLAAFFGYIVICGAVPSGGIKTEVKD